MAENRRKIEEKLKSRPTLIERHSQGVKVEESKVSGEGGSPAVDYGIYSCFPTPSRTRTRMWSNLKGTPGTAGWSVSSDSS